MYSRNCTQNWILYKSDEDCRVSCAASSHMKNLVSNISKSKPFTRVGVRWKELWDFGKGPKFVRKAAIKMAAFLTNFGPLPKSQSSFYLTPTLVPPVFVL